MPNKRLHSVRATQQKVYICTGHVDFHELSAGMLIISINPERNVAVNFAVKRRKKNLEANTGFLSLYGKVISFFQHCRVHGETPPLLPRICLIIFTGAIEDSAGWMDVGRETNPDGYTTRDISGTHI